MRDKGVTMLELIIVLVLLAMLAGLAMLNLSPTRERTLDSEAINNLALIQRSEKGYKIENNSFYPAPPTVSINNIALINQNLGLVLPTSASRAWNYEVWSTGCSRATRTGANVRYWYLPFSDDYNKPKPTAGCP